MRAQINCRRRSSRGFTLVELMAVVVITGILAVAGVSLFRQQVEASKGGEAASVIQAIRAAEEAYYAEYHVYLNVSSASDWYPNPKPNASKWAWVNNNGHPDFASWRTLAPSVNRAVRFGYLVNAGDAGSKVPVLQLAAKPNFPSPMVVPWYVIQARGDVDGNGVSSTYAASSLNSELAVENEGE